MTVSALITQIFVSFLLIGACSSRRFRISRSDSTISGVSLSSNEDVKRFCALMSWFKPHQKTQCLQHPVLMLSVQRGVENALKECPKHFRDHRWNCTGISTAQVFQGTGMMETKSRESAFAYAITAAGVTHEITRGCSQENWQECGCDKRMRGKVAKTKKEDAWEWGGCSDNVKYGYDFARRFMDPPKPRDTSDRKKMLVYSLTVHNNEVGRRAVRDNMTKKCKCHGVSLSCTWRVCWRVMPPMTQVAERLRQSLDRAVKVKLDKTKTRLRIVNKRKRRKRRPATSEIAYHSKSPNFCTANPLLGITGTKGRVCDKTSDSTDGCRLMCCGRGHVTKEGYRRVKCNCKFIWCCRIQCDWCQKYWTETICK